MLKNLIKGLLLREKSLDRNLEIICVGPPHGLTIYQVSAQSNINCSRSYMETKKFTDGRKARQTDAEGYNIIQPFFKRAYNKIVYTAMPHPYPSSQ